MLLRVRNVNLVELGQQSNVHIKNDNLIHLDQTGILIFYHHVGERESLEEPQEVAQPHPLELTSLFIKFKKCLHGKQCHLSIGAPDTISNKDWYCNFCCLRGTGRFLKQTEFNSVTIH